MKAQWQHGLLRSSGDAAASAPLVLKIGGSLLSCREWPSRIEALIAGVGDRAIAIVVGGGAIVDGLRTIDNSSPQPAHVMHELAIDAMHLTAQLVCRTTGLPLTAKPRADASACVLDVPLWLLDGGRSAALPPSWDVTSDSIAARVADEYSAELLLAKSVPPPANWCGTSIENLARTGWVDRHFPKAASGLERIGWTAPR